VTTTALHVWRVPAAALPRALWRVATGPARLHRRAGTRFVKLLGTGRDRVFGPGSADLTRWAAVTVTDGPAPDFPEWAAIATASCRVDLRPLSARGSWAGRQPFPLPGADAGPPGAAGPDDTAGGAGRVLAITRARLRPSRAAAFWRAIGPAAAPLATTPGLLAAFGIGEAPLGWQGTVSLWRGSADLLAFAYRQPEHRRVVERTPVAGWYAEELFARFAVLGSTGDVGVLGVAADSPDGQG
jgi:hypothetical protein